MQTSIQLNDATKTQIAALTAAGFGNQSAIIRTAVDRMFREECKPVSPTQLVEMAKEALDNWDFTTDDGPASKRGLDAIVDGTFRLSPGPEFHVRYPQDWDGLEELAATLGNE